MKASAIAHSNIAFIKYWGRSLSHPAKYNIPLNDTVSMTKYGMEKDIHLQTHTTIEFRESYKVDIGTVDNEKLSGRGYERVVNIVNIFRELSGNHARFKMMSWNDFPIQAGMASSASGFAALAQASTSALKLAAGPEELSKIVRTGSGSAGRSLHDGFVYFRRGTSPETSYAEQICSPEAFDIRAVIAVVNEDKKKVTSDDGHMSAQTSLFNDIRIQESHNQAGQIKKAILKNNFSTVGKIAEENCKLMHAVMMTSRPPLFYWQPATLRVIKSVLQFREEGVECYFTIDAGPNVHCLCRSQDMETVNRKISKIEGVKKTIRAKPGPGAFQIDEHLF